MNVPAVAVGVNPAMAATTAQANRGYAGKTEETEPKDITTEQIQAMLDENSSLIVEIISLNTQIKHGKGTTQLGEFTEKLDKKRKQLNKNLMTLAKWADESSDQPPRPQPAFVPPQAQYGRPMAMNPMAAQQMGMGHPQMQMPRYAAGPAQMQAQALAQAQYHARMASMNPYGGGMPGAAPRYHDGGAMPYGSMPTNVASHPMAMGAPMPSGYVGGAPMGYPMATPHGYGMMAPQGMQRMNASASDAASTGAQGASNP
ncbi:hypothetical protein Poli38472_001529 [Pythium oligandrum]|uniref:SS18 N-terminal domain-containing protein n=1 Tax=Pythium oligandrum TaxID=41045 RepID=A0A8K1FT99_PYTOL|nr:hypothetical protein Poli38472_001529 [Pythium oligandrum]|eukprot:TMW69373.1 hypothetical protein Poli38472_001529 [Pythium oligandrum]